MARGYNIGTECYALLTSSYDAEMLLPVKIVLLEKYSIHDRMTYKVKIREIFESNFELLKEHLAGFKVSANLKSENKIVLIKKSDLETVKEMSGLMEFIKDKEFFLEENYITLDKDGLYDLYDRFVKYLINYHYRRLYQIMSRSFLANRPVFENQKEMFKRRINKIGFGDMFEKYNLKYNPKFAAEDYELWTRVAALLRICNIQEPLLKYRLAETQVTHSNKNAIQKSQEEIKTKLANHLTADLEILQKIKKIYAMKNKEPSFAKKNSTFLRNAGML